VRAILVLLILALPLGVWAQPQAPDTVWTRFMGANGSGGSCKDVQPTADGGFVGLVEWLYTPCLIKLDAGGDTLWCASYSNETMRYGSFNRLRPMPNGGFIFAGWDCDTGLVLICVDSTGGPRWRCTVPNAGSGVFDFCLTADGGYFLAAAGPAGAFEAKLDAMGDTVWTRKSSGDHSTCNLRVWPTSSGHTLVAGSNQHAGDPLWHVGFFLLEFDEQGDTVRMNWYDRPGRDVELYDAMQTGDHGAAILGYSYTDTSYDGSVMLIKVNASGDLVLSREPSTADWQHFVVETPEGGFIIAGETATLTRLDGQGDVEWTRTYPLGAPFDDLFMGTRPVPDGGFIACGVRRIAGIQPFMVRFSTELSAQKSHLAALLAEAELKDCYPNPFNPSTEIAFELPRSMNATLKVFYVLGREVAVLEDGRLSAGEHRVSFDGSGLPSGVYFCRLAAGDNVRTRKMLLLK